MTNKRFRDEDFLMCEARLVRLRREIDARIEPVLLEESNDKSGFLDEILKTGEIIYSAGNRHVNDP